MTFKSILFCLSLAASMGQAPVAEAAQLPEPLRTDIATSKNTPSRKVNFDSSWRFFLGDEPKAAGPLFDDSKWRTLTLPHDWSIEHSVDKNAPAGNDGGYRADITESENGRNGASGPYSRERQRNGNESAQRQSGFVIIYFFTFDFKNV